MKDQNEWAWTLEIKPGQKGGPGSGHHGHAGRPGQVGGSAPGKQGMTTSDDINTSDTEGRRFYRGGKLDHLESILQEGIKPSGVKYMNRPPAVYVTESEEVAHEYGFTWSRRSRKYAIVEIVVPKEEFTKFKDDKHERDSYYLPNDKIPPEWIRGYKIYEWEPETIDIEGPRMVDEWKKAADGTRVLFLWVVENKESEEDKS